MAVPAVEKRGEVYGQKCRRPLRSKRSTACQKNAVEAIFSDPSLEAVRRESECAFVVVGVTLLDPSDM